jgi:hypothetical protein
MRASTVAGPSGRDACARNALTGTSASGGVLNEFFKTIGNTQSQMRIADGYDEREQS